MQATVLGIVRHALTTAGGGLITAGYLTGNELTDAVGAVMVLIGVGLSINNKRQQKGRH